MSRWQKIALGEVIRRSYEIATLDPEQNYHELTIKIWGKGIVSRGAGSARRHESVRPLPAPDGYRLARLMSSTPQPSPLS